jgi:NAD(P)H-dependent flavin oxidoreductase YrpB (nitropropane dioxygenase family)
MDSPLGDLGVVLPVVAAPMAGGPSTAELVIAAARVGGLGFLAAGYKTTDQLGTEIAQVRSTGVPFGVNVFVPNPLPVDADEFRRYARAIQPEADEYGLTLDGSHPKEDDDHWDAKIELLLADPVPVVSFTFGVPHPSVVERLRRAGTIVVQTVTSASEAGQAAGVGVDVLAVQCSAAGGHSGTFTPRVTPPPVGLVDLLRAVRATTTLPLLAAGGLSTAHDVAGALEAGAVAVAVGTALLRTHEAGTSEAHLAALGDPSRGDTVVTHAFTGRPARAVPNRFTRTYSAAAPFGYPAIHHLTSPLRRAAAASGHSEQVNLWAGTGYRHASVEAAGDVLVRLAG